MVEPTPLEVARRGRKPPPDRGKVLDAREVSRDVLRGKRSASWVRRNVPGKIRLGHSTVVWYEYDVLRWMEAQREG